MLLIVTGPSVYCLHILTGILGDCLSPEKDRSRVQVTQFTVYVYLQGSLVTTCPHRKTALWSVYCVSVLTGILGDCLSPEEDRSRIQVPQFTVYVYLQGSLVTTCPHRKTGLWSVYCVSVLTWILGDCLSPEEDRSRIQVPQFTVYVYLQGSLVTACPQRKTGLGSRSLSLLCMCTYRDVFLGDCLSPEEDRSRIQVPQFTVYVYLQGSLVTACPQRKTGLGSRSLSLLCMCTYRDPWWQPVPRGRQV